GILRRRWTGCGTQLGRLACNPKRCQHRGQQLPQINWYDCWLLGFLRICDLRLLRIRNLPDPVPNLPPKLLGFFEVVKELQILVSSSYLKLLLNPHSLELYMHGVAGYNGIEPFKFVVQRDIALLNKEDDHLKGEYNVPPKWRSMRNKAMYQSDDGSWKLHDYMPPPPETVVLL
ncbi:unnamed protein product, partial [Linum tenue]